MKNFSDLIIETTLIGTGGGYGEGIIVHLGFSNWIVVDSCINPFSGKSLSLEYLMERGVDLKNDVKLIVCTHWHNDHIQGISQIVEKCENAVFATTYATDRKKFLQFVGLDCKKIKDNVAISSTSELGKCLSILGKRKRPTVKKALQDRILFNFANNKIKTKVISLSPSDFIVQEFDKEISTLISTFGSSNKRIPYSSPNEKSVVLYIKINDITILLGSDLEVSTNINKGWLSILNENQSIDSKASVFKIPHHGSKTAYHKKIWEELVESNAISKLSPYNRGKKLPNEEMIRKIKGHSQKLFITSLINSRTKAKKRDRNLEKAIFKFNKTLSEVRYSKGIVRCHRDLSSIEKPSWEIELIDAAVQL